MQFQQFAFATLDSATLATQSPSHASKMPENHAHPSSIHSSNYSCTRKRQLWPKPVGICGLDGACEPCKYGSAAGKPRPSTRFTASATQSRHTDGRDCSNQ